MAPVLPRCAASNPLLPAVTLSLLLFSAAAGVAGGRHGGFHPPRGEETAAAVPAETGVAAAAMDEGTAAEEVRRALSHVPAKGFAVFRQLLDERYDEIASALVAPLLAGQPITLLVPTDGCFHPSTSLKHSAPGHHLRTAPNAASEPAVETASEPASDATSDPASDATSEPAADATAEAIQGGLNVTIEDSQNIPSSEEATNEGGLKKGRRLSDAAEDERPMGHEDDVDEADKAGDVAAGADVAGSSREVADFLLAHVLVGAHCHGAMSRRQQQGAWQTPMLGGDSHVTRLIAPSDESPLVLIHKQGSIDGNTAPHMHRSMYEDAAPHMHAGMRGGMHVSVHTNIDVDIVQTQGQLQHQQHNQGGSSAHAAADNAAAAADNAAAAADNAAAAADNAAAATSNDISPGRQPAGRFAWSVVTVPDIYVSKRIVLHGVQHH
ncbi:hypothetical protein CLOM_g19254 [Closterium sp. NIES-68]|nr:hypothetical protein CLOM_g19254 [Closterium sp. NIES-68]